MNKHNDPGDITGYHPGLTAFLPMIPSSITRRIPRLYSSISRSLRTESASHIPSTTIEVNETSTRPILSSYSEPDLEYYGSKSDIDTGVPQRPATAGSSLDRDSYSPSIAESFSSNNCYMALEEVGSGPKACSTLPKYEAVSGLQWTQIVPALNFLHDAGFEARQPHCDGRLVRSMYVKALGYLLDALPGNLTFEETMSIRQSLPDQLKASTVEPIPRTAGHINQQTGARYSTDRSCLHRLLASSIVYFFIILQFLMPYIKATLRKLYQFERSHHITERALRATASAADSMGKSSASFGSAVMSLREGQMGAAASSLAAWWVEGLAGGIHEGVGEGMTVMGLIRPNSNAELEKMSMQVSER